MKTWKLVSGIISIIVAAFALQQSGVINMLENFTRSNTAAGAKGVVASGLILAFGIVSIVTRQSENGKGNTAIIIMSGLATYIAYSIMAVYGDMMLWGTWSLACCVVTIVDELRGKKPED